ncbi:MAG: DUF4139 domain-containing protein [Gammaproteobacteria bacterium]|jgi:hypothetical protein|nr:DUF4139 domain-containing protein [Gammaproteobacteria bacterium]MBT4615717.1 DUF4139 domain-containing protein [Gammaproteobacteria bacterium]MBT5198426.1 DUF4139 domain-containing protein [Gammaproteobacteria bacterium]MBT5445533.1 DUF4139 domain-containing protein [Gammaproteobacteria bacterium]MBT5792787.1 DUF4139 domain-containing protein [Gammaproteobacteria bacterium]
MKHLLARFLMVGIVVLATGIATASQFELGVEGRTRLALTVFNSNLTVVRDQREVVLPTGEIELEFTDVARTILPPTVSISSAASRGFSANQQNYRFDLLNPNSLLERFVGSKVKYSKFLLQEKGYEKILREGILLSINPEIVKFGDVIEISPEGTISLPYIPDDLNTSPTLVFKGENQKPGKQELTVRYHAAGVGWEADYALTLEKEASLSGWVTIRNQSSSDFAVDELVLVAGDVNRNPGIPKMMAEAQHMRATASFDSASPVASSPGDYHAYRFPGQVNLLNQDMTQLKLISADGIRYEKSYRLASVAQRFGNQAAQESSPAVWISIAGSRGSGLNKPLPAGNIRVYERDKASETFIGESRIGHTAAGHKIDISIGRAFDVSANRIQTSFQRFGEREAEVGYRIEMTNDKPESVVVSVEEQLTGDWTIISESQKGTKRDSMTYVFELKVPSQSSTELEYSVRFKW